MKYSQPDIAVGAVLQDRYRLDAELGEGGFGTVYRARQLATGQDVAVKVLRWSGAGGGSAHKQLERFQREAQLSGQLHHPNIVRLIDSGSAGGDLVYTVFELVPGKTLREVLAEEGALEPREARYLMLQILDALSCAHAKGVVHRDLKPRNIMVVATGARRNAQVLDFGIGALTAEARTEGWMSLTPTNESLGTPGYAAPEQLRGQPPSPRSDLFSWGLVFLECLTGAQVFAGSCLRAVLCELLGPEPVPIPDALRAHPLGDLLRRVTVKDVRARDVCAEELLRELEDCDLGGLSRAMLAAGGAGREPPAEEALTDESTPEELTTPILDPDADPGEPWSSEGALSEGVLTEGRGSTLVSACEPRAPRRRGG